VVESTLEAILNRRILTLLVAVALLPIAATSVAGPPGLQQGPDLSERLDRMTQALELDAAQAEIIGDLLAASHDQGKALRERGSDVFEALQQARDDGDEKGMRKGLKDVDQVHDEGHVLRLATRDAIRAELSLEQQVIFEELNIKKHERERRVMDHVRDRREQDALGAPGERGGRARSE
jgi:hypothetical protein